MNRSCSSLNIQSRSFSYSSGWCGRIITIILEKLMLFTHVVQSEGRGRRPLYFDHRLAASAAIVKNRIK